MPEPNCRLRASRFAASLWRVVCGALAALALEGCSTLEPCDHRDLEGRYGFLCGVRGVRTRNEPQRDPHGFLVGTVSAEATSGPIIVFAYRRRGATVDVADATTLSQPGPYSIAVPAGIYGVAAFEDTDEDLRYDPARERAALYHDGGTVAVRPGESIDRLYVKFRDDRPQRIGFDFFLPESSVHGCCDVPAKSSRTSEVTRQ